MTEDKRFKVCTDSNGRKSLWDEERTEEEPLICLNKFDEIWGIDDCCNLLNKLHEQNLNHEYFIRLYTGFLTSKGYGLGDIIRFSKEMEELNEIHY